VGRDTRPTKARSTSDVFAGGAPGARTLNPRNKSGPLGHTGRSSCADATRGRTESTHCTGIRPTLVPRVVPRHPRPGSAGSVTVSDGACPGEHAPSPYGYFTSLVGAYADGADHDVLRAIREPDYTSPPVRSCSGWPLADLGTEARCPCRASASSSWSRLTGSPHRPRNRPPQSAVVLRIPRLRLGSARWP
jgi:hypothetical protein